MTALETALPVVARVLADEGAPPGWTGRSSPPPCPRPRPASGASPTAPGHRSHWPWPVGEPATLCLVDPGASWTVDPATRVSRSANTPFAGTTFTHRVVATLLDGRPVHTTADLEIP